MYVLVHMVLAYQSCQSALAIQHDESSCPVRVFHPFNVGGACGGGRRGVSCLLHLFLLMFRLSHVWFHDPKLAGNLESEVGTQSWWGPSCGCDIDLGPNLRKEA